MSGAHGYSRLRVEEDGAVVRVTLDRPQVRNAFDEELIAELTRAFQSLGESPKTRAVVLSGEGPSFCAGADITWMRKAGAYSREENEADALRMARMLAAIDSCPRPVVAVVHAAAIGGGVGLVAAADIVVAAEGTVFSLAEVKLGILPAAISPYVLRAIGPRQARRYFLTGERFDAREALRMGLVHRVVPTEELAGAGEAVVAALLTSGPEAVVAAKSLIGRVTGRDPADVLALTAQTIAERRASEEAQEGLTAFLEKRPPSWSAK